MISTKVQSIRAKKLIALLTHYLIGYFLAGVYLLLEYSSPSLKSNNWMSFIFGVSTVLIPWFWLYPSIGLGILAVKSDRKITYVTTSLINHLNFGIGFFIWIQIFQYLFIDQ